MDGWLEAVASDTNKTKWLSCKVIFIHGQKKYALDFITHNHVMTDLLKLKLLNE